jgi:hypothetical protein
MEKVILNKVEYNLPTSYQELTVGAYKRMVSIKGLLNDEINQTQKTAAVLSKILNIGIKDVYLTTMTEFGKACNALAFLNNSLNDLTLEPITSIIIDNEEYFFKEDLDSMSVGEMISLEIFAQEDQTFINMMAPSLAILLRRKDIEGKLLEFDADKYQDLVKIIEDKVSIADVYQMYAFFLTGDKTSIQTDSGDSSEKTKN